MAGFLNQPLDSLNGSTITDLNNQLTANVTEGSAQATATANGYQSYQQTLQSRAAITQRREYRRRNRQHAFVPKGVRGFGPVHQHDQPTAADTVNL